MYRVGSPMAPRPRVRGPTRPGGGTLEAGLRHDQGRRWRWGVVAIVGVVALLPYTWVVGLAPTSRDAVLWIANGDPSYKHFAEWILHTRHFNVGYRPVTGLSYTVGHLVAGFDPTVHRIMDLALHAATVIGVHAVYRRLWPGQPWWGGGIAAAIVALHPIGTLVVPHLARRAYPLATTLILAALLAVPTPDASTRRRWIGGTAAATLAGLAALAHEAGYLAFALIALLGLPDRRSVRRQGALLAATFAVPSLLLLYRTTVVQGGLGGYRTADAVVVEVLAATLQALVPVTGLRWASDPQPIAAPILAGFLLAGAVVVATGRARREVGHRVALGWLVGLVVLYLPQGVWFPRQVYVVLPGLGLLIGGLAAGPGGAGRWVAALVGAATVVATPVVWGVDPDRRAAREGSAAVLEDVARAVASAPAGARVWLAVPRLRAPTVWSLRARETPRAQPLGSRVAALWATRVVEGRTAQVLALIHVAADAPGPWVQSTEVPMGRAIVAVGSTRLEALEGAVGLEDGVVVVPWAVRRERPEILVIHDGTGTEAHDLDRPEIR